MALRGAALGALLACCLAAAPPLPARRTRFVATTNGHASSYQPLADLFIAQNASYNVASAYCSSPGPLDKNSTLPSPPFCYSNWTLPIKQALPHGVLHLPIVQMLGGSGPEHFKHPYVFAELYVQWAQTWGFDGYLLDAEFKGDDKAYVAFLDVVGAAMHNASLYLGVFLYPSMSKARYVNGLPAIDHWLGTWGGRCSEIPDVIWGLHHDNNVSRSSRANLMLYPRDNKCTGHGIEDVFSTLVEGHVEEVGFWANSAYLGESWLGAMAAYIAGN